jgi:hypothetical protein
MKTLSRPYSLALTLLLGSLGLSGCGGALSFPDAVVGSQVQGPPMQGIVYGGHAPIVGAHVYVLQPGTSGYGSAATSLLGKVGSTTVTSASGSAITENVNDPNVPAGAKYVTSDSSGAFNLTGGYSCVVNQPVYLYSYGTSASTVTSLPTNVTETITGITVSGVTADTNGNATYVITLSKALPLTAGEGVTINGLTGNLSILNNIPLAPTVATQGTTFTVSATAVYGTYTFQTGGGFFGQGQTQTFFDTVGTGAYTATAGPVGNDGKGDDNGGANRNSENGDTSTGTGPFGSGGTATASETTPSTKTTNPQLELATLGICPSSGNFSTSGNGALSFVNMNEVSTVATAYTFQPFTVASNNNAWDIGTSGSTQALLGIANAAQTAAQLYDIQGANLISTVTNDGEGHLANVKTAGTNGTPNTGNGTVPQATIDSLANILAACIDSTPLTGGFLSTECTTLFNTATDNGQTIASGDTAPTDTATAAINIARYPSGNHGGTVDPTYVSDIFGIPSGIVPYVPDLTSAPNDWTIAITYSGGNIGEANVLSPHNVAVDGSGNIYHANFTTKSFTVLNPLGVPVTLTTPTTLDDPTSVALDSTSTNVWLANQNAAANTTTVTRCTITGADCVSIALGSGLTEAQDAEVDANGNIWATAANNDVGGGLVEISSATTPTVLSHVTTTLNEPTGFSIANGTNGLIWVGDTADTSDISHCTATACTNVGNVGSKTENTAIDSSGDIWVAGDDTVAAIASGTFTPLTGSPFATGLGQINDGMAIDGNNTVWVANNGAGTVLEFSATNGGTTPVGAVLEVSPAQGYTASNNIAPEGIAVDPSGNVWYDDTANGDIVELVGAGAPTVMPLSFAVANGKLGAKP